MTYRPEIDGLRAIAVLSVVLYHFGVPNIGGGFVGVDVFFVISGFLIGGLLWTELTETGRLRLGRFYLRRVRRLAPAYFAMAAVTAVFAALVFLPFEFREFGKELIAATVWLSNVLFYRGAGYFDIGAESKALLHTWSLSVEEQFYVVLPLALLLLRPSRTVAQGALILAWALSLAGCIWLTPTQQTATFYLFPFRAWELLTGVLLAVWMRERGALPLPGLAVWVGLALILGAVALVQGDGFPGWQAIAPVTGTALILAATDRRHPALRLLASPVPVFVGLISYSLYLWHWPVLILSRYWRDGYADWREAALWLGLAFVLSVLSWWFVERPVRRREWFSTRRLLTGAVTAGAAMLAVGGAAYVGDGLPARFPQAVRPHIAASQDFLQDWSRCTMPETGPLAGVETCGIGPEGPPEVIVWGDSHLRAMMDGIALAAEEQGVPGLIIWHAGCPPLFDVTKVESAATRAEDAACTTANATIRAGLAEVGATRLLLVGRWTYYAEGAGIGRDAHNTIVLRGPSGGTAAETQAEVYSAALVQTVRALTDIGFEVSILRQVPEIAEYDSREFARRLAHGRMTENEALALSYAKPEALASRVMNAEAPIFALAAEGLVRIVDPWVALCQDRCSVLRDGQSLYFDNNHLTNTGALILRDLFIPALTGRDPEDPPE